MSTRPDLEGQRLKHSGGQGPIYLVVDGILRWVPSQTLMKALFRDYVTQTADLSNIMGFNAQDPNVGLYPLPYNSFPGHNYSRLFKSDTNFNIYLIDYNNIVNNDKTLVKRYVKSPNAMDAYNFAGNMVVELPHIFVSAIPNGPPLPHP
jgi:hypothetical protein